MRESKKVDFQMSKFTTMMQEVLETTRKCLSVREEISLKYYPQLRLSSDYLPH